MSCPTDTLTDLHAWSLEFDRALPRPAHDIAYIEHAGAMVDLDTNDYFTQTDNWTDFTRRWLAEQTHRGQCPDTHRLAEAILKANDHHYDYALCRQIAVTTLRALNALVQELTL